MPTKAALKATPAPTVTTEPQIVIQRIGTETLRIPIVGTAPQIHHRFAQKARQQMLDKMQGRTTPKKSRDPQADYEECFYRLNDGSYGFPSIAFKAATVGAARFYGKAISMTALRQFIYFHGEFSQQCGQKLVRIIGEPLMREDVVTVGMTHDLRYRPEFTEWSTTLEVTYVSALLSRDSVLSLVEAGGMGVGVGEWRVEKSGEFGTYAIDPTRDVEVVA